jgi:hypothetical protein
VILVQLDLQIIDLPGVIDNPKAACVERYTVDYDVCRVEDAHPVVPSELKEDLYVHTYCRRSLLLKFQSHKTLANCM